jgi:glycosyltransferase involved in cell wall biosynthesis
MVSIGEYFEICVLTHNRIEFVSECLSSIINHTTLPYKITVFDNASTDGTLEYLKTLEKNGLIHKLISSDKNLGIAEPKNILLGQLEWKSNFVVMTDSDIYFPYINPCWIEQMVKVMNHHPNLAVLSMNFDSVNVAEDTKWWFQKQNEGHRQKKEDLLTLETGFWGMLISKDTVDMVSKHNQKKYDDPKVFRCRTLYGETDEAFRQVIHQSGKWCGVAKNVTGLNLGWDDNRKFQKYNIFKKIERSKAEELRRKEDLGG